MNQWTKLACNRRQLDCSLTLVCGQSFRWQETEKGTWKCAFGHRLWSVMQPDDENIMYKVETINEEDEDIAANEKFVRDYFQMDVDLESLYSEWRMADPQNFSQVSEKFAGIRILRQDPVETLFAFICSANNNITRISKMVQELCTTFGTHVRDGFHSFPSVERLAESDVELKLRKLGFGYRSKYIHQTAIKLLSQDSTLSPSEWLLGLRKKKYSESREIIMKLPGVGPKVADCICLMALDKSEAIPVDTHIIQIAARNYIPSLKTCKSVTPKVHAIVGDHFRSLFGSYAGWAQSVLFASDLKKFKNKVGQKETEKPPIKKRKLR